MAKKRNPNHPKKGARIAVDPIRKIKDIKTLIRILDVRNGSCVDGFTRSNKDC